MGVGGFALRWVERGRLFMGAGQQGYLNIMVNDRPKTFNYTLTLMALHKSNGLWIQITHNVTAEEGGGVPLHILGSSRRLGLNEIQNVLIMWGFRLAFAYLNPLGVLQVANGVFTGVVNHE